MTVVDLDVQFKAQTPKPCSSGVNRCLLFVCVQLQCSHCDELKALHAKRVSPVTTLMWLCEELSGPLSALRTLMFGIQLNFLSYNEEPACFWTRESDYHRF